MLGHKEVRLFAIESIPSNSRVKKDPSITFRTTTSRLTALHLFFYHTTYVRKKAGTVPAQPRYNIFALILHREPVLDATKRGPANARPPVPPTGTQNTLTSTYIFRQKGHQKKTAPGLRHTPESWLIQKTTRLFAVETIATRPITDSRSAANRSSHISIQNKIPKEE